MSEMLLTPVQIGSREVRNRVVFTAHGSFLDFYRPGIPGDQYIAYEERRAEGGVGLIVLQTMHVHRSSHALGHYTYDPVDLRPKLRRMAETLHRHEVVVVQQLNHFGAQFRSDARKNLEPLWGFQDMLSGEGEAVHAMTDAEVEEVVEAYVDTALLCIESGIDGVELHCTHGYLLQQSFSPWGNRREGPWGEPLAFLKAIIAGIRAHAGREPIVGLRVSTDDFMRPERGGLGPAGINAICRELVDEGQLDYVNQSEGARTGHYARSIGSYRHALGEFLPLAHGLREAIGQKVPVIAASRINDPAIAEGALQAGDCDLVAMTRAMIADPDLVRKTREGRRIRHCVGANQGCVDRMVGGLHITCFHNPDVGREERGEPAPAEETRRVLVVGGGPAGLKAAEIAARRGHAVTLLEREAELGGRLRWVRKLGDAAELFRSVEWLEHELADLGVDVRTGVEAGEAALADADVVVLATGSKPAPDRIGATDGSIPVLSIDEAVARDAFEGRILYVDARGDLEAALGAEHVAASGGEVTIVTPFLGPGPYLGFTHMNDVLTRLYKLGCTIETSTVFGGVGGGETITRHVHSGEVRQRAFDLVVAGCPGRADTSLSHAVQRAGKRLLVVGDAVAPRTAMHAFREGDEAGRAI
jgi:2,4-dienoyl-CoA reductase-like NADH-dependent reductase (Old Yellow Enzyme family)